MHKFLRSIGFSEMRKKDMDAVLREIIENPELMRVTKDSEGNEFAELSKNFAPDVGITVCGTYQEDSSFKMDYYYPYMIGTSLTTREQIDVEKHADKESYAGVCDELNLGVTLIFYLQNVAEYLADYCRRASGVNYGAMLAGLSVDGRILFPVRGGVRGEKANVQNGEGRSHLIVQARDGDDDAIENLTLGDMDAYAILSQRIAKEDILSIVRTTFMPYGIESDQYSILGEILDVTRLENCVTHEKMYGLKVCCNDIIFHICINDKDLLGEPDIGRRFKGSVWLQGRLCAE